MNESGEKWVTEAKEILDQLGEMARGTLIVDENLLDLVPYLENENIRVEVPGSGTSDEKIRRSILFHEIFVTNNSKDFLDDAVGGQYSIIATERVTKDPKNLAKMISQAIRKLSLWSYKKRYGWMLQLSPDGQHTLSRLEG